MKRRFAWRALLLAGCLTRALWAETGKPITNTLPTLVIGPYPIGFLFPGFNTAAGINPAALPSEKATAFQAAVAPPINNDNLAMGFASLATSNKKLGIGAGYLGQFVKASPGIPSSTTNEAFGGLGFRLDPIQLGVGVQDVGIGRSGSQAQVDFSMLYNGDAGLVIGGELYDLNTNLDLALGVGFRSGKKYHIEADLLLPTGGGEGAFLVVAGAVAVPLFDVFFNLSYLVNTAPMVTSASGGTAFFYAFGIDFWVSDHVNFVFQYNTLPYFDSGFLTGGITIAL
jgi:hypothetical protein